MSQQPKTRRMCFTLNNYTEEEANNVATFLDSDEVVYGIVGREQGEQGTPHLQGFFILRAPQRYSFVHSRASPRLHLEVTRAKSANASEYCKKEGDYDEYGELPNAQGKRSDIDNFVTWVKEQSRRPSEREIAVQFPSLFLRYRRHLLDLCGHLRPDPVFPESELRDWQSELESKLEEDPDDRTIMFYVDNEGGKGKTWFMRYWFTKHPEETQMLSIGKRDDLAYAIDETKSVFIFDIPRGGMEYFQYAVVEKLKDGVIFSSKYESRTKVLEGKVHVVVFSNEEPDYNKLSADRFHTYIF